MIYSHEVEEMCTVNRGASHGCAPIPEEGKWVYSREIKDISGLITDKSLTIKYDFPLAKNHACIFVINI